MWSVPSHNCFLCRETASNSCFLPDSHSPIKRFQSAHGILPANLALVLVILLTRRFLIFDCRAVHPLVRCDPLVGLSACTTRRYL